MKRLCFRLADPQYPVPSRRDFNEFIRGAVQQEVQVEDDVVDQVEKQLTKARRRNKSKDVQPEA